MKFHLPCHFIRSQFDGKTKICFEWKQSVSMQGLWAYIQKYCFRYIGRLSTHLLWINVIEDSLWKFHSHDNYFVFKIEFVFSECDKIFSVIADIKATSTPLIVILLRIEHSAVCFRYVLKRHNFDRWNICEFRLKIEADKRQGN